MTNREKYEKEILDVVCDRGLLAVDKHTNKVMLCKDCVCQDCKFDDTLACVNSFREWLNAEYVEQPKWKFTEDEKAILRNLPENYKWIARDSDGNIFVYEDRLRKASGALTDSSHHRLPLFNHMFQTIKWEDEEPCEFRKYIGEQNG